MSQNQTKHYYWLKLQNDFFNRDEIKIIKGMPNGKDYLIFYLEIMLKSINTKGTLMFKDAIVYTPEMLASITQTDIDTVRVAIDLFVKLGLIEVLNNGALFMKEVHKLVGSETIDAERKRNERLAKNLQLNSPPSDKKRTMSGNCPENVTLEYRDKSIEIRD